MDWRDVETRTTMGRMILGSVRNVGPVWIEKMLASHQDLGSVHDHAVAVLAGAPSTSISSRFVKDLASMQSFSDGLSECRRDMDAIEANGGVLLSTDDEDYPVALALSSNAPPIIRVFGPLPVDETVAAVVGTRTPNRFGTVFTQRVSAHLTSQEIVIVSGMADGVDRLAHSVAIGSGRPTIAVLGCGFATLDRGQRAYASSILDAGGCIVSQFPMTMRTTTGNLMTRNAVVAGLSHGLICTQGSDGTGGTRKTMSDGAKMGRPIFVPIPPQGHEDPDKDGLVEVVRQKLTSEPEADVFHLLEGSHQYEGMVARIRHEHASVLDRANDVSEDVPPPIPDRPRTAPAP